MIDTHCHLDVERFAADRDVVIARATALGIVGMLVPAIRPRMWPALVELVTRHAASGVRIAFGVHPQVVPELDPAERALDLATAITAAVEAAGPLAVAIGECGLDGGIADHELQEAVLRAHIRAARATRRPLVIHVLRAHDAAVRVLREERIRDIGGVLHSYSGGAELVPVYRDLGLAFSFAGPVTYANARRPLAAARAIPDDLLLVETDAPDQAPEAHRGGRSEPAFLPAVIAGLATARGVDAAAIASLTTRNARGVFRSW